MKSKAALHEQQVPHVFTPGGVKQVQRSRRRRRRTKTTTAVVGISISVLSKKREKAAYEQMKGFAGTSEADI